MWKLYLCAGIKYEIWYAKLMTLLDIFFFVLGTIIGSFLNVLIDRLSLGKNPWKGRSHCDFCKKTLQWYDLVPLFSFLLLRGCCRYCNKRLSWQYPIVELFTGLMFAFLYSFAIQSIINNQQLTIPNSQLNISLYPIPYTLVPLLIVFSSFLVIFVADLKYWTIPDEMVISSGIGSLLLRLTTLTLTPEFIFSGLGASLFFLIIYLVTRGRGMGFGDVKLALVLGLFLGFPGIVVGLYAAFLTGATVSLILIILGKKRLKQRIAFGPFLILGTITSFLFGNQFIEWYMNFLK